MRLGVGLLTVLLCIPAASRGGSVLAAQFNFSASGSWADLKPSFKFGRDRNSLFAVFLRYGATSFMQELSYWEGVLENGRLGYFEYAVSEPTSYDGVLYPKPLMVFADLDFFFPTLRAPEKGGRDPVFRRIPVRLSYGFSIRSPWFEGPLNPENFRDFGFLDGSARGFAKLPFFGEYVEGGVRPPFWLYHLRHASIDLVHAPEAETYVMAGAALLFVRLGHGPQRRLN